MHSQQPPDQDSQVNFLEARDPAELAMCVILAAAYAGLARYCWGPLHSTGNWRLFLNVEGFFITIAALALLLGLRPYLNPCSLQLSRKGIKYRGPYWPQRRTVNWDQVFKLYVSQEVIIVLYHPKSLDKGIWPMVILSVYLSDREKVVDAFLQYCPVVPTLLTGPSLSSRLLFIAVFIVVAVWILESILG